MGLSSDFRFASIVSDSSFSNSHLFDASVTMGVMWPEQMKQLTFILFSLIASVSNAQDWHGIEIPASTPEGTSYAEAVVTSVTPADTTFDHDVEYINLNGYGFAKNMTTDWLQVKIELNLYILVPNATPRWQPVLYTLMTDPDAESANDIFTAGQLKKMTAPTGLLPHPANNKLSLRLR